MPSIVHDETNVFVQCVTNALAFMVATSEHHV